MQLYWYINGVLVNQTNASYAAATVGGNTASIGSGYVSNYDGQIDELRIWNTVRTQLQVQNNNSVCLTGAEAGLAAYYQFSDGINSHTVTDLTAFSNNGVLTNMDPFSDWVIANYDYYCPTCESSRTGVVATITSGTPVNLGADECLSGNKLLDAGVGYTSYLWSTGATTQTINVSISGSYWVQANAGGCVDSDTITLTFIAPPVGQDSCRMGPGEVTLGASGSTGFYNWYTVSTGGTAVGTGNTYTTPVISSTTNYYVAASEPNYALDFDGSDDYIALGNLAQLQITGDMTIEMWLKPDNFSARRNPYAKAYGGEGTITQEMDGTLSFYYGTNGGNSSPYQGFNSVVPITLNQWNHIAIVRDLTNMQLYWYINGVLVNQTNASYAAATVGGNTASIGSGYVSNYDGQIDELRIWSATRTQAQIQANMSFCVDPLSAGLNAYYDFNDGTNSTTASDLTSFANNSSLHNMDPSTDWVSASNNVGCSCESSRTIVTATISSGVPVDLGNDTSFYCGATSIILDAGAGYSNYLWSNGATSQTINATTAGNYWVQVDNGSGCIDNDTISISSASGSLNALDFDGSNDYIALGNLAQLQITGDMTIEMWLKPDNFSARRNPYAKAYGGEGTITQEMDGTLSFYYGTDGGNSSPYQGFNSVASLNLNQWNHIAIVRDLTNMQLYWYINGVLTSQTPASYATATAGGNTAYIGAGYVSNYDGQIDELRIWDAARTQTEVRNKMCSKLVGGESGLVAYYRFDDGYGTVLSDLTANGLDGILTNGPTWTTSGASIGDNSTYIYPASWSGQSLTLSFCSGENLTIENMGGNPDGVHIYSVGDVPNTTTGIDGLGSNNRYFGVFKVNDAVATYTATYDYTGNVHAGPAAEPTIQLYKRANNADVAWVNTGATLNTSANTLVATAQGTEFMLGSSGVGLPIELVSFEANINEDKVDLKWVTTIEINNDYFTIERSVDGKDWEEVLVVNGAGNSNQMIEYYDTDYEPLEGISYYRLKQTDFNGDFSFSNIVPVRFEVNNNTGGSISLFPSPINVGETVNIEFKDIFETELLVVLRDIQGKEFYSKLIVNVEDGKLIGVPIGFDIPAGVYLITATSENQMYSQKLIIK
jgi:hypothetical protein